MAYLVPRFCFFVFFLVILLFNMALKNSTEVLPSVPKCKKLWCALQEETTVC